MNKVPSDSNGDTNPAAAKHSEANAATAEHCEAHAVMAEHDEDNAATAEHIEANADTHANHSNDSMQQSVEEDEPAANDKPETETPRESNTRPLINGEAADSVSNQSTRDASPTSTQPSVNGHLTPPHIQNLQPVDQADYIVKSPSINETILGMWTSNSLYRLSY